MARPAATREGAVDRTDWTPSPVAEREDALRKRRVVHHDAVALTAVPAAMLALTGLVVWLASMWAPLTAMVAAAFLVPLDFWIAHRIDSHRAALVAAAEEADRLTREEFGDREGWLVDLYLHRAGATIGRDRGMIWVEDGRLMFAGGRMSFSIGPDQVVEGGAGRQWAVPGLRHRLTLALPGGMELSFDPDPSGLHDKEVRATLREWSLGHGEGGQLPPATLGPGAPSPVRLLAAAIVSTSFWAYLGAVAFLVLQYGRPPALVALAALVGVPLNAWYPLARWRALLARRRLDREAEGG